MFTHMLRKNKSDDNVKTTHVMVLVLESVHDGVLLRIIVNIFRRFDYCQTLDYGL